MSVPSRSPISSLTRIRLTPLAGALLLAWLSPNAMAAGAQQPHYATADEASTALMQAVKAGDPKAVDTILGPGSEALVTSGDPVVDEKARVHFVAEYEAAHKLSSINDNLIELVLGPDLWPFPIPLVKDAKGWRFDSRQGADEILRRRIGQNELAAIQVVRAYVDAQREYQQMDPAPNGAPQYAQKLMSTAGTRDGLYWSTEEGQAESPLGPLFAQARGEGYSMKGKGTPYYGYFYRILKAQGAHAPGGAQNYIVDGKMTGGFALVAYPAKYGASGVMSFIVDEDGIVYQKALGSQTTAIAQKMTRFDPDTSWKLVQ